MFTSETLPASNLLNKREAARFLGVTSATIERLMRGGLPYIKLTPGPAGTVRFSLADLNDFVEARTMRSGNSRGDAA